MIPTNPNRQHLLTATGLLLAGGLALSTMGALSGRAHAAELELETVNKMDHAAFTKSLGGIFENSP